MVLLNSIVEKLEKVLAMIEPNQQVCEDNCPLCIEEQIEKVLASRPPAMSSSVVDGWH